MFIKTTTKQVGDKTYQYKHLVRSYRDDQGVPRHEYLLNLSQFPAKITRRIEGALDEDTVLVDRDSLQIESGDCLRGGGQLAIWRAWEKANFDQVLSGMTEKQRQSTKAMVFSRITDPCSKLAIKERIADTFLSPIFSKNRLDQDTLYEVMDVLNRGFYRIQRNLQKINHCQDTTLLLYDTTSTYFEGTCAAIGAYGHSKDKRMRRYQIIVGVVTNQNGMPLQVLVWPGNKHDADTINKEIDLLRKRFDARRVVFVSDSGTYSEENMETIRANNFDYIVSIAWNKQKKMLEELAPQQLRLFDEREYHQWGEDNVRYVGCHSEAQKQRQRTKRQKATQQVKQEFDRLKKTASSGRYYHKLRLYEKVSTLLKEKGVRDLFSISIQRMEEVDKEDQKCLLDLDYRIDKVALRQRKALEGKYILETTIEDKEASCQQIESDYKELQKVERGFRNIKSFLNIRPIHHRLERRIRAHVLICFLAYYLVKWMEVELHERGEESEVEAVLSRWDNLKIARVGLVIDGYEIKQYKWTDGQLSRSIREEIEDLGLWQSIEAYARGIKKKLESSRE